MSDKAQAGCGSRSCGAAGDKAPAKKDQPKAVIVGKYASKRDTRPSK